MNALNIFFVLVMTVTFSVKVGNALPFETTTIMTTVPYDSCYPCRDAPVQFTETWAGQCVPSTEELHDCRCQCLSIFCREGEVIDTTTCRPYGSIHDCRCIPIPAPATTVLRN
ncbi:hypothetical protein Bhyg_05047 [Pseudolycoriella hygida]|uniref:Uncharacterized protein n=1 Tax=Pseudolycoriella hygida TaxID=35572 RepID=A0A9Q0S917_9DIPT|nr:hypothetical protein Bhyg_05047 [Pseudolycoriella hygida]